MILKIAKFFSAGMLPTIGFFLFTIGLASGTDGSNKIPSYLFNIREIDLHDINTFYKIPIFVGVLLIFSVLGQYYDTSKSINDTKENRKIFFSKTELNLIEPSEKQTHKISFSKPLQI